MADSASTSSTTVNRHALTAVERQRSQLDRLLKDPSKPAFIPPPPKDKTIRPAREMMKNVQGSSAGAGSGEFHVYKAGRRREYERLQLIKEEAEKEAIDAAFDAKRREAEAAADAKTAKNRAKRQKKKERTKSKGANEAADSANPGSTDPNPTKKRRLVNGTELVFRKPGEDDSEEDPMPEPLSVPDQVEPEIVTPVAIAEELRILIHEDD